MEYHNALAVIFENFIEGSLDRIQQFCQNNGLKLEHIFYNNGIIIITNENGISDDTIKELKQVPGITSVEREKDR